MCRGLFKRLLFLVVALSFFTPVSYGEENLLPFFNREFIRLIIFEQAIEVSDLVEKLDPKQASVVRDELSHDFGIPFYQLIMERERLQKRFQNLPAYKKWRLSSDVLIQEGLTQARLGELQIYRRDKLFNSKIAVLQPGAQAIENPSLKASSFWTGMYVTPSELKYERIYAIKTLTKLKERRAFDIFFRIAFSKKDTYESEV